MKQENLFRIDPEEHLELFLEFCDHETWSGGPDPELKLMRELIYGLTDDPQEQIWMIGAYCCVHCVPSAWHTVKRFPSPHHDETELVYWVQQNTTKLPTRIEMRSARMAVKRINCLMDFREYARNWKDGMYSSYEECWDAVIPAVRYCGRYMAIKLLEFMHMVRPEGFPFPLMDLRPADAWSPRMAMSLFYPEHANVLNSDAKDPATCEFVNELAKRLIDEAMERRGVELSWFDVQVLLCEYKQCWGHGFYPACTADEEADFMTKVHEAFDPDESAPIMEARAELFPHVTLGELNGWWGHRKDCASTLKNHGYVWSDRKYHYEGHGSACESPIERTEEL